MIFLKCKIRFIYVGFSCKKKSEVKKCLEILPLRGDGRLMANAILNFHFDFLNTSLSFQSQVFLSLQDVKFKVGNPSTSRMVDFLSSLTNRIN